MNEKFYFKSGFMKKLILLNINNFFFYYVLMDQLALFLKTVFQKQNHGVKWKALSMWLNTFFFRNIHFVWYCSNYFSHPWVGPYENVNLGNGNLNELGLYVLDKFEILRVERLKLVLDKFFLKFGCCKWNSKFYPDSRENQSTVHWPLTDTSEDDKSQNKLHKTEKFVIWHLYILKIYNRYKN